MNDKEILFLLEKKIQTAIRRLGQTNMSRWNTFCGFNEMTVAQYLEKVKKLGISISLEEITKIWAEHGINKQIINYNDFVALLSNWNWSKFKGDHSPVPEGSEDVCVMYKLPENNRMTRARLFDAFRKLDKEANGFVLAEEFDKVALDFSISYNDVTKYDTGHNGMFNYLLFLADVSKKDEKTSSKGKTGKNLEMTTKQNEKRSNNDSSKNSGGKLRVRGKSIALIQEKVLENGRSPTNYFKSISFGGRASIKNILDDLNIEIDQEEMDAIEENYGDPMVLSSFMRLVSDGKDTTSSVKYVKKPFIPEELEIEAVVEWLSQHSSSIKDFDTFRNASTAESISNELKKQGIFISAEDISPAMKKYGKNLINVIKPK